MKILILPSLLILLPLGILFLILKYWTKGKSISIGIKFFLGIIFITLGLLTSFYAMTLSLEGMMDKNIKCATGVVVFIPFGLFTYMIGVPLLISLYKPKKFNA